MSKLSNFVIALIFSFVVGATPALSQDVAEFYRGKTINMVVGGSAGGGYDALARAIARFIGNHLPGSPSVLVRNMPGAGGMIATNYMFSTAEKDGSVFGLVENSTPLAPLFGTKEARYDATKLNWLGTPSVEVGLVLLWHTVPVNTLDDLRTKPTTMGASGVHSTQAFYTRLLNATLGTKMRVINGYTGLNETFLAMERGEIDGSPSVFYSALSSTRPRWLPNHLAKVVLQYGPQRVDELPDVPFVPDLISNLDDKLLLEAAFAPAALGRPLVMPPGVPSDRVSAMRKALAETFIDPEFRDAAAKLGLVVNAPRTGLQLQAVIEHAYASPSGVIDRLRKLDNPE